MATETRAGRVKDIRALSTASGGTALTTTAAYILFPEGTEYITVTPRNFSTAVVARWILCPYLIVLRRDGLYLKGSFQDMSSGAQDADTDTDVVLSSLNTAANNSYMYVGCYEPFRGVRVDIDSANGTASVITVNYWNGTAWTDSADTDGTDSGGASMAVDGSIVWTVPTAWRAAELASIENNGVKVGLPHEDASLYWTRWQFSAQLDGPTTANSFTGLNRSTAYGEFVSGQAWEQTVVMGPKGHAAIEALTNAGTANLIVNGAIVRSGEFA